MSGQANVSPLYEAGSAPPAGRLTEHQALALLADSARHLLLADNPQTVVQTLLRQLAPQLQLDVCFHYEVERGMPRMRLAFFHGVPPELARALQTLDFDHPLCRSIVANEQRVVLEDLADSTDPEVQLVRCHGMSAFVCYPLSAYGGLLGLLGIGSRSRPAFSADELDLLQSIALQLAAAIERLHMIDMLQQRNKSLQAEVAERQRAVASLQHREEQLRGVFEQAAVGIAMAGLDGRLQEMNPTFAAILGYSTDELCGMSIVDLTHPDDVPKTRERMTQLIAGAIPSYVLEKRYIRKNGSAVWSLTTVTVIRDPAGAPVRYIGVIEDITERKRAEEAVRLAQRKYEDLVNAVDGIVWEADAQTFEFTFVSRQAERLLGYPVAEWLTPKFWLRHVYPDDRDWAVDFCVRATREGRDHEFEYRIVAKDGRVVWLRDLVSVVMRDGQAEKLRGIMFDITAQKQAEAQVRASLQEKEVLLKEIHHRVKNNMQIISSLLSLQAESTQDPAVLSLFEESNNRIRSMALVHEKLYGAKDLSVVDMASYLHSLVSQLRLSYGDRIPVLIAAENIHMNIDTAIPCGLILNELISNAIKHAFPLGADGCVEVEFRREADSIVLAVRDNGIGMPAHVDMRDVQSLGLRLVATLVDQLSGTIAFNCSPGTHVTLRFPASGRS